MDTINLVNNGKPYFFRLDIAKESGQIARFTDWIKARVSDNGKKVPIQWYDQGTVMNVHGFYPFIEGGVGKWIKDDDTGELVPSTDVVYRTWQGTPADTSDNGIAYYTLEDQFFTKQGEFVGTFGLRDDNGNNLTSVNLVFQILGNDLRLTQAKDYYIKDLENLKRKFENDGKQVIDKVIADNNAAVQKLNDDYTAKTQEAQNALTKATSGLNSYAATVETMDGQIKAKALATKPDLEQAKSDITKYVESKTENLESVAKANFNTVASLNDLKTNHTSGAEGYWITLDTKHMYIWSGSDWTDLGLAGIGDGTVPGQTIKDKSIFDTQVGTINASKVLNSYAEIGGATSWGGSGVKVFIDGDNVSAATEFKGDRGIIFPVKFTGQNFGSNSLYVDFSYFYAEKNKVNHINAYAMREDNTLIDTELWHSDTDTGVAHITLTPDFIKTNSLNQMFKILIASHGDPVAFDVQSFRVSEDPNNTTMPKKFKDLDLLTAKNGFDITKAQGWNLTPGQDVFYADSTEAVFKTGDATAAKGIVIQGSVIPGVNNYIHIEAGLTAPTRTGITAYLTDGRNLNQGVFAQLGAFYTNAGVHSIDYVLTPAEIKRLGIVDKCTLTIGGQINTVMIRSVRISTTRSGSGVLDAVNSTDNLKDVVYGSSMAQMNTANAKSIDGLGLVTPGEKNTMDNARLKHITLYAKEAGGASMFVGKLDQNNLLVDYRKYQIHYSKGFNELDFSTQNIAVNKDEYVFLNCSILGVYNPDTTHPLGNRTLLQDAMHVITGQYSGKAFTSVDALAPFEYTLTPATATQLSDSLNEDILNNSQKVNDIKKQVKQVAVLTSPSGKKFRISVDDNGTLSAVSTIPTNVQIFGNSLTSYYEDGSPALGATDQNHDWYHYVTDYIKSANSAAVIGPRRNIAPWEQNTDRNSQFNTLIRPNLSADTDLVILQLGDNVNSDALHANFANDVMDLLKNIKAISPKAKIYFVGMWFCGWQDMIDSARAACSKYDGTFVDITDLANNSDNKAYIGEVVTLPDGTTKTLTSEGEANHPGNAGYKKIADRIIDSLDF